MERRRIVNLLARTLYYFYELKRNLSLTPSKLREIQRRKLRTIVKHAYENVPFYHRKFSEAKIKPEDIKSVDDLSKIPPVTRIEVQSSPISDFIARGVRVEDCTLAGTSGSTGKPLTFYFNKSAADFRFALLSRTYWEDGVRPWHKMAKITYPTALRRGKGSSTYPGVARRKSISVFDDVHVQLAILQDYQPDFINSYPSSMVILAHACKEKGISLRPRLILTGSEFLYSDDAKFIRSTFECDSIDDYGCQEIGPLAWECRQHMGYHLNIDGVVVEFLDQGEPVTPGEQGETVCTSLVNYAMPFIRYVLGDSGTHIQDECSCGRPLPLMKILEGRKDDFFTALDGRILSPLLAVPYWIFGEKAETIKQIRVIQERRDKLTIEIVGPETLLDVEVQQNARREITKVFGEGMQVEFQLKDKIERDASGKLRKAISHVPLEWQH